MRRSLLLHDESCYKVNFELVERWVSQGPEKHRRGLTIANNLVTGLALDIAVTRLVPNGYKVHQRCNRANSPCKANTAGILFQAWVVQAPESKVSRRVSFHQPIESCGDLLLHRQGTSPRLIVLSIILIGMIRLVLGVDLRLSIVEIRDAAHIKACGRGGEFEVLFDGERISLERGVNGAGDSFGRR